MEAAHLLEKSRFYLWKAVGLSTFLVASTCVHLSAQTTKNLVSPDNPVVGTQLDTSDVDTASQLNSMDALNDDRKLSIGDSVSYRVIEEEKDPIVLTVKDSGDLSVPLLGLIPAAGKTCKELARQLKPLLEKDYFYNATVIIGLDTESTRSPGKIYLTGQVHAQGSIDLPPNEKLTVSQAIMANGGFADFANQRRVTVIRREGAGKTQRIIVDVKDILTNGHAGDTIEVPEKLINF
jgi:protein involved in polysaccharide export with SLBB domain